MTFFVDQAVCGETEGLLCLSDLAELQQPLCDLQDPCLHFFPGMGFRPAAWVTERDQYGDKSILIVSGDHAYMAKYDMALGAFGLLPEGLGYAALPATPIANLLAVPTTGGGPAQPSSFPGFGGFPGFPGGGGSGRPRPTAPEGNGGGAGPTPPGSGDGGGNTPPGVPGGDTGTGGGGGNTDLPPLTPIPLSGSGMFLVIALALMLLRLVRARHSGVGAA